MPAALVTICYGESGTAKLLILSQVILSLQLPFAIIPLVMFTATGARWARSSRRAGSPRSPALIAAIIVALNVKLIADFAFGG